MDVSKTVLLSTTEGKKVARFINLGCFEGGTTAQPGERGRVLLGLYQGDSCCSCFSFSMKGNEKLHCVRVVAKTGSALLSWMGQLHCWGCKSFALFRMIRTGDLLFLSSLHHWEEMRHPTWPTMYWTGLSSKCKSLWLHSSCGAPVIHKSWDLDQSIYSISVNVWSLFVCLFCFCFQLFS